MAGAPPPGAAPSPPARWLIVNGDDLGLTAGVNAGIERAYRNGILRSASAMATGAALEDAAQISRRNPGLGIGLHLTLVGERPACRPEEVPSLVGPDGRLLPSYRAFLGRYLRGGIRPAHVRREFQAQAARLTDAGLSLDHLDSHQHLHLLPGLLALTVELARERGILWIRAPRPLSSPRNRSSLDHPLTPSPPRPIVERLMFAAASGWARRQVARAGFPVVQGSLGFDCSGHLTAGYLLRHIPSLPAGITELICHPGSGDPETQRQYGAWGYCWQQELDALTCGAARSELERGRVGLASFGGGALTPTPRCADTRPLPKTAGRGGEGRGAPGASLRHASVRAHCTGG